MGSESEASAQLLEESLPLRQSCCWHLQWEMVIERFGSDLKAAGDVPKSQHCVSLLGSIRKLANWLHLSHRGNADWLKGWHFLMTIK